MYYLVAAVGDGPFLPAGAVSSDLTFWWMSAMWTSTFCRLTFCHSTFCHSTFCHSTFCHSTFWCSTFRTSTKMAVPRFFILTCWQVGAYFRRILKFVSTELQDEEVGGDLGPVNDTPPQHVEQDDWLWNRVIILGEHSRELIWLGRHVFLWNLLRTISLIDCLTLFQQIQMNLWPNRYLIRNHRHSEIHNNSNFHLVPMYVCRYLTLQ
jgi:hypothetical protein